MKATSSKGLEFAAHTRIAYTILRSQLLYHNPAQADPPDNITKLTRPLRNCEHFRKLKNTGAIAFGIKVYTAPISIVRDNLAIAKDLIQALDTMNKEQKQALAIDVVEENINNNELFMRIIASTNAQALSMCTD